MSGAGPTVFVVDDDASVRKSLARLVGSVGYTVETFASAKEFLARAPSAGPACLVLDIRMPGMTGMDLQEALTASARRMAIVFLTGHVDVPTGVTAMKRGAADLLTKPADDKQLLAAIRRALAKDTEALGEAERVEEVRKRVALLSPRETQVFALVVTGMLNKQIAGSLGISEKTVKVHRARVMEKMRAGSVAELVRLADRAGVIRPTA